MAVTDLKPNSSQKLNISLDYRLLCIVLAAVIIGMLALWRPWTGANDDSRTVQTTGEAVLEAVADEFVFYPTYAVDADTKEAALAAMTVKSDEITKKLKELDVADEKIKTNASNYDDFYYPKPETGDGKPTYSLQLTIEVTDRDLAQKVQDYLITTTPSGTITPQASFSDAKRKELESQARDEATKDARAKAEQSAKNLGFGLGKVKSVEDGTGFGGVMPVDYGRAVDDAQESTSSSLGIQPGENEIRYTVTVTYYLK